MMLGLKAAASLLLSFVALTTKKVLADDCTPVVLSHQGPLYWALPIYVADQRGFFEDQCLNVSYEVYPSGAPQVADAEENKAWDVGGAGVAPNIIGGAKGIDTIAISNDESETNALAGTATGVTNWPPSTGDDFTIIVTPNSTAHYVVEECLFSVNLNTTIPDFSQQAGVLEALAPDANGVSQADYGGLWAPNLYLFLENTPGSEVVCSGKSVGAVVPGGIMVRREYGEANPGTVAKVLAAWLRGIEFVKDPNNRAQVLSYMEEYYAIYNVSISMKAMEDEIDLRPLFGLDEQLELFKRDPAPSTADAWYLGVSAFLEVAGVLASSPDPESYITDKYLKLIDEDPELRLFSTGEDSSAPAALLGGNFKTIVVGVLAVAFSFM